MHVLGGGRQVSVCACVRAGGGRVGGGYGACLCGIDPTVESTRDFISSAYFASECDFVAGASVHYVIIYFLPPASTHTPDFLSSVHLLLLLFVVTLQRAALHYHQSSCSLRVHFHIIGNARI